MTISQYFALAIVVTKKLDGKNDTKMPIQPNNKMVHPRMHNMYHIQTTHKTNLERIPTKMTIDITIPIASTTFVILRLLNIVNTPHDWFILVGFVIADSIALIAFRIKEK